MLHIKIKRE